MKISSLIAQLEKAKQKYGDINVGAYSQDYAQDVDSENAMWPFVFRVVSNGAACLPGVSMDEDEEQQCEAPPEHFGVIFYKD